MKSSEIHKRAWHTGIVGIAWATLHWEGLFLLAFLLIGSVLWDLAKCWFMGEEIEWDRDNHNGGKEGE